MSLWLEHLRGGAVSLHRGNGYVTRSIEAGTHGPSVIMLHGTNGHAETYIRNVVDLADAGYRVYSIDMIGHGFSSRPPDCNYLMSDYVDHVYSFMDTVDAHRAFVVGESLGGLVAMLMAIRSPERIRGIINVVGGGLRPIPPTEDEQRGWASLDLNSKSAFEFPSFENWRKRMEWLVFEPSSMTDEMVHVRMAINESEEARQASAQVFASVIDMLMQRQPGVLTPDDIASVSVPVFYLWTDHNPTTPASVANAAHELTKDSRFHVMTQCAHWPQYENSNEFNKLVLEFLDSHRPAPD